jgi:undecaprenyl diphosphate synthase
VLGTILVRLSFIIKEDKTTMRIPNHIGIIPDGNRRWSLAKGLAKEKGYDKGLDPGVQLFRLCRELGVKELTYYGFTMDNTKRPSIQTKAFTDACVKAVEMLSKEDASLLVVGNTESQMFPKELMPFTKRKCFGSGAIKINFLVNYGWDWDLSNLSLSTTGIKNNIKGNILCYLNSYDISRIDLIIRWGGMRRLSGFLPVQSIYSDFYVVDEYWPDFTPEHLYNALDWYGKQDVTLGG